MKLKNLSCFVHASFEIAKKTTLQKFVEIYHILKCFDWSLKICIWTVRQMVEMNEGTTAGLLKNNFNDGVRACICNWIRFIFTFTNCRYHITWNVSKYLHQSTFAFQHIVYVSLFFKYDFLLLHYYFNNIWSGSRFNAFRVAYNITQAHHESYPILCIFGLQIIVNEMELKSNKNERKMKHKEQKKCGYPKWPTHWANERIKRYNET